MNALAFYPALVALLLLAVLFSASETALMALNRLRLKYQAEAGDARAVEIQRILSNTDRLLGVLLLGATFTELAAASLLTYYIAGTAPESSREIWSLVGTAGLTVVVLIVCELAPKIIAAANPEVVSRWILVPVRLFLLLLSPFARLAAGLANGIVRLVGIRQHASPFAHALSEEEIRSIIADSSGDELADEKKEMLHNVFEIGATQVRGVMIPRTDVTTAEIGASIQEILDLIARTNYSRIPIYRGTFDNMVGVLNVKDLLPLLQRAGEINLQAILRPAHFVPDTARIETVLQEMQSMHLHMAIVVDEFGGVEGIVTLEDLLEEIVGEIRDEFDVEAEAVRRIGPELYSLAGNLPVKEFNRLFETKVPESREYATVVGFLQARTGRLLQEGETVRFQDLQFSIEKVEGFKTVALRVRVPAAREAEPAPVSTGA